MRCSAMHERPAGAEPDSDVTTEMQAPVTRPRVAITYCTQCNWLLRSAWMAQELLSTFRDDLGEVALIPATGGAFRIELGGALLWERVRDGGFPDVKALKQRVRDHLDPERDLGHIDRS
ncbi:selenoprotein W-related protein [Methylobacterium sp. OAE515]|jgi:selenoprotein W-related protein